MPIRQRERRVWIEVGVRAHRQAGQCAKPFSEVVARKSPPSPGDQQAVAYLDVPELRHQRVFLAKALERRVGIGVVLVVKQPTGSDGCIENEHP